MRQIEDEVVVYDPVNDCTALLNESAAAILELCDGTHTAEAISRRLAELYHIEESKAHADVEAALGEFFEQSFFEPPP